MVQCTRFTYGGRGALRLPWWACSLARGWPGTRRWPRPPPWRWTRAGWTRRRRRSPGRCSEGSRAGCDRNLGRKKNGKPVVTAWNLFFLKKLVDCGKKMANLSLHTIVQTALKIKLKNRHSVTIWTFLSSNIIMEHLWYFRYLKKKRETNYSARILACLVKTRRLFFARLLQRWELPSRM